MNCPLCRHAIKDWKGSDRVCAYPEKDSPQTQFTDENWNCATMNKLRDMMDEHGKKVYSEDQTLAVMPMEDGLFLSMTWYKNRGRVDDIRILMDATASRATLEDLLWIYPMALGGNLPTVK